MPKPLTLGTVNFDSNAGTEAIGNAGKLFDRAFERFGQGAKTVQDGVKAEYEETSDATALDFANRISAYKDVGLLDQDRVDIEQAINDSALDVKRKADTFGLLKGRKQGILDQQVTDDTNAQVAQNRFNKPLQEQFDTYVANGELDKAGEIQLQMQGSTAEETAAIKQYGRTQQEDQIRTNTYNEQVRQYGITQSNEQSRVAMDAALKQQNPDGSPLSREQVIEAGVQAGGRRDFVAQQYEAIRNSTDRARTEDAEKATTARKLALDAANVQAENLDIRTLSDPQYVQDYVMKLVPNDSGFIFGSDDIDQDQTDAIQYISETLPTLQNAQEIRAFYNVVSTYGVTYMEGFDKGLVIEMLPDALEAARQGSAGVGGGGVGAPVNSNALDNAINQNQSRSNVNQGQNTVPNAPAQPGTPEAVSNELQGLQAQRDALVGANPGLELNTQVQNTAPLVTGDLQTNVESLDAQLAQYKETRKNTRNGPDRAFLKKQIKDTEEEQKQLFNNHIFDLALKRFKKAPEEMTLNQVRQVEKTIRANSGTFFNGSPAEKAIKELRQKVQKDLRKNK